MLPLINYVRLTGAINKGDDGEGDGHRGLNNMVEKKNNNNCTNNVRGGRGQEEKEEQCKMMTIGLM